MVDFVEEIFTLKQTFTHQARLISIRAKGAGTRTSAGWRATAPTAEARGSAAGPTS